VQLADEVLVGQRELIDDLSCGRRAGRARTAVVWALLECA